MNETRYEVTREDLQRAMKPVPDGDYTEGSLRHYIQQQRDILREALREMRRKLDDAVRLLHGLQNPTRSHEWYEADRKTTDELPTFDAFLALWPEEEK